MSDGTVIRRMDRVEKRRRLLDLPRHVTEKRYTQTDEDRLKTDTHKPMKIDFFECGCLHSKF